MKLDNLRKLFVEELRDLYSAETQLVKALPKMAKAAEHDELRSAFESHLEETQEHVNRLERVFEAMEERPKSKKCKAMQGLIQEGEDLIKEEALAVLGDVVVVEIGKMNAWTWQFE